MSSIDALIKKAEEHFQFGVEAYKQNNVKKAEIEFRTDEKICSKIYFNDVKLQFIKCELSHLYLIKKNFALAYQYLFDTLPVNRSLYGENSIEVLTNHIELVCLAIDCIDHLSNTGFSVKQTSQKLFRQLLIKMTNKSSSSSNRQHQRQHQHQQQTIKNLDVISFEEIDKKLSNCDELLKWKIIFKRHYQTIIQLYSEIVRRDAKIASNELVSSLNKLAHLKKIIKTIEN